MFGFSDKRSAEHATSKTFSVGGAAPTWNNWTVARSTKEGYIASGFVYRAVNEIKQAASSVTWLVVDSDNKPVDNHHITALLNRPNPGVPRQQFFELLIAWLQLSGNAYSRKVTVGGRTTELWLMTPDKVAPVAGTNAGVWVKSYHRKGASGSVVETYNADEVTHFLLPNPANPLQGISPLQAAARAVDTDVAQLDFNKSAMDNRGVLDGVFVFKELAVAQWDTVREKIRELYTGSRNARTPGVLSAEANYIRTGMTPAEMDFLESRKFNRDEIMLIFGVPPQLVGAQESSTFNNFAASQRIFWEQTIIPLLRKMQDTLQHSLSNELANGERIVFDTNAIAALQDNITDRVDAAKTLWDMGVPITQLNDRFELGLKEIPNADLAWTGNPPRPMQDTATQTLSSDTKKESRASKDLDMEWRAFDKKREELTAGKGFEVFSALFKDQKEAVLDAVKNGQDPIDVIKRMRQEWIDKATALQAEVAKDFM